MAVQKKKKRSLKGDKALFPQRKSMAGRPPMPQAELDKTGDPAYAGRRKTVREPEVEAQDAGTEVAPRVPRWPTAHDVPTDFVVDEASAADLIKYGYALEPPFQEHELMTDVGLKKWVEVTDFLLEMQVLKQIDCLAISRYCIYFQDWVMYTHSVNEFGATITIRNNAGDIVSAIKNPACVERNKAELHMKKLESNYGFTPASRVIIGGQQARGMGKNHVGPEPIKIPDPIVKPVENSKGFFEKHGS